MKVRDNSIHVPDNLPKETAFKRTTHLGIGAHQDDLEIFAFHGIASCYNREDQWFGGVTVTDGRGSARIGNYKDVTDEEMMVIRGQEQNKAADIGQYAFQVLLNHSSSSTKDKDQSGPIVDQLLEILMLAKPDVVYLHNPADKHDVHIAVLIHSLEAIRRMPVEMRPRIAYGCEVWRNLDWVADDKKVALPVDQNDALARELIDVFASQIAGGKNYTESTLGRRTANATYFDPFSVDTASAYTFALDLTPLIRDDALDIVSFTAELIDSFKKDVKARLGRFQ